eukprot:scaffold1395_cov234-Chaetoceros_neogracile.AAC.2
MSSTCTAEGICTVLAEPIQPIAPQAQILTVRNNLQAYLEARSGAPELKELSPIFPKSWHQDDDVHEYAETDCSLYMAESSIPNAGLGMFAGRSFVEREDVDPSSQVIIPLIDLGDSPLYIGSVLSNYPWSGWAQDAHLEAKSVNVLYPNLGMLANSHLGLSNVDQTAEDGIRKLLGSSSRMEDISAGANTLHHAATFKVKDKPIQAGQEIFVDYGSSYFHHREKQFDMIFPTMDNYATADKQVRAFAANLGDEITEKNRQDWKRIIKDLEDDDESEDDDEESEDDEKNEGNFRVAFALPESVEDVKYVAEIGTARYSIPESTRSLEWLEDNGVCLDNIKAGKSSIPYAGHGAFAVRRLSKGSIVAPMPLVPVLRSALELNRDLVEKSYSKDQLLLNYCIGHPGSTLLFFPYSSSVHFINHSNDPNSIIRWSESDLSQTKNFDKAIDEVYTGLIMEVVALRDIKMGEEVTIDYGPEWTDSWRNHISNWQLRESESSINPARIAKKMNEDKSKPIMTVDERENNPLRAYPECIRTACYSSEHNGTYVYDDSKPENLRFCRILDRVRQGSNYWYEAKMEKSGYHSDADIGDEDVVVNIPRYAIKFVMGEYCSDMHLELSFRHEISVPADMYPEHWLDMLDEDDDYYE